MDLGGTELVQGTEDRVKARKKLEVGVGRYRSWSGGGSRGNVEELGGGTRRGNKEGELGGATRRQAAGVK